MAARAEKKLLAKRFADAISEHCRDLEHAYVYWIWLRGSGSYVIISDGAKKNSKGKLILLILDDNVPRKPEIVTNSHKCSRAMRGLRLFAWALIASLECLYNLWLATAVMAINYFCVELNNKYLFKSTVWPTSFPGSFILPPHRAKDPGNEFAMWLPESDHLEKSWPITLFDNKG